MYLKAGACDSDVRGGWWTPFPMYMEARGRLEFGDLGAAPN